jgi:hypothetical protein
LEQRTIRLRAYDRGSKIPRDEYLTYLQGSVESHFGKTATMAVNLLNMVAQGERAYGFLTGTMDAGFDVTVGFFTGKARYVAFKKRSGKPWDEGDLRAALLQIGPWSNWAKPITEFVDYVEKVGNEVVAEATGWQTAHRRYAFVYVPNVAGEISILPDKSSIDPKFSS